MHVIADELPEVDLRVPGGAAISFSGCSISRSASKDARRESSDRRSRRTEATWRRMKQQYSGPLRVVFSDALLLGMMEVWRTKYDEAS